MIDWTFIFMARIQGGDRGLHVLASGVAIFSTLYCAWRVYRLQSPKGIRALPFIAWLPLICATFFYGLHETIFNPIYFGHAYLSGQAAAVTKIFADPTNITSGLLDVQVAMCFFGFLYLRKSFKPRLVFWLPFFSLVSFWLIIGLPVTVPNPSLASPTFTNTLFSNILESFYTLTFGIGFCGAFR